MDCSMNGRNGEKEKGKMRISLLELRVNFVDLRVINCYTKLHEEDTKDHKVKITDRLP
jgi:hypothetical protein